MSTSKQFIPIFVGSTYQDLIDYRAAVRDSLHKLETVVHGMEYFGSRPGSPKHECLKQVSECKIYIGIFGMRYGSLDEETKQSLTHLEYSEAQRLKLPSLIYIIDEDKQPVLTKNIDFGENANKLIILKDELKRKFTVSFFTTPDDLAKKIAQDLPRILKDIGIQFIEEKLDTENIKDLIEIYKNRPKKYAGSEIIIEGKILNEWRPPSEEIIEALKLTLGDTICNTLNGNYGYLHHIYAEGVIADKLEKIEIGRQQKLKLKLLFGVVKSLEWADEEVLLKQESAIGFKVIEIINGS